MLVGAFFYESPLQERAEAWNVPNPSKSAWFLLWTQELVSYGTGFAYIIPVLFAVFIAIPFVIKGNFTNASWFKKDLVILNIFVVAVFLGIILLTVIAAFFRGEYWHFVF